MEPADKPQEGGIVPEGGELHPVLLLFAPLWGRLESVSAIRRFHDLRSFHQRLLEVRPLRGRVDATCETSVNKKNYE